LESEVSKRLSVAARRKYAKAGRVGGRSRSAAKLAAAQANLARTPSHQAANLTADAIRAQEDADYAFIVANNLLARENARGHIVDRLMTGELSARTPAVLAQR
jgi:hypothetical protein